MADHADEHEEEHLETEGHAYAHPHGPERSTAPQSPYTNREVGIGAVIALAGMILVFVVPILLT